MQHELIFTNKLCVFFLTTLNEYYHGTLKVAIDTFFSKCNSKYKFDLLIYFDEDKTHDQELYDYFSLLETNHENIKKVEVVFNNIPKKENFYNWNIRTEINLNEFPMGASHGVNHHFYMTLDDLFKRKYNNFLLLEADTMPVSEDWFDVALEFTNKNSDFFIAGSKYKGKNREFVQKQYWGGHLNGVAIYKNCKELRFDLEESKNYLIKLLKENPKEYQNFMNYDVAIYLYFRENCNDNIKDYLYDTNFIVNISDNSNRDIKIEDLIKEFPKTRIVHRKDLYVNEK